MSRLHRTVRDLVAEEGKRPPLKLGSPLLEHWVVVTKAKPEILQKEFAKLIKVPVRLSARVAGETSLDDYFTRDAASHIAAWCTAASLRAL